MNKQTRVFGALDAIDPSYLEEAANARRPAGRARILQIILPAAAIAALLTVSVLLLVPLNVSSPGNPTDALPAAAPAKEDRALEDLLLPTPDVIEDENGLVYEHYGDHVEIKGYLGSAEEVVVPAKIDGTTITKIDLGGNSSVSRVLYNGGGLAQLSFPDDRKIVFVIGKDVVNVNYPLLHSKCIRSIEVDEDNPVYASCSGMLFTKDLKTLILCPAGIEATELYYEEDAGISLSPDVALLPAQLQTVGNDAFTDCPITRIVFSSSLTNIERGAFRNCKALSSLSLPSSLRYLSGEAFDGCTNVSVQYEGTEADFDRLHVDLPGAVRVFCASAETENAA